MHWAAVGNNSLCRNLKKEEQGARMLKGERVLKGERIDKGKREKVAQIKGPGFKFAVQCITWTPTNY